MMECNHQLRLLTQQLLRMASCLCLVIKEECTSSSLLVYIAIPLVPLDLLLLSRKIQLGDAYSRTSSVIAHSIHILSRFMKPW